MKIIFVLVGAFVFITSHLYAGDVQLSAPLKGQRQEKDKIITADPQKDKCLVRFQTTEKNKRKGLSIEFSWVGHREHSFFLHIRGNESPFAANYYDEYRIKSSLGPASDVTIDAEFDADLNALVVRQGKFTNFLVTDFSFFLDETRQRIVKVSATGLSVNMQDGYECKIDADVNEILKP